jgi:hypothetical protein
MSSAARNITLNLAAVEAMKEEIEGYAELVVKMMAFQLFRDVILISPVDTGRYRASWTLQVTTPDESVAPEGQHPGIPDHGTLNDFEIGKPIFLNNSLPYASALEDGHSGQAPGSDPPGAVAGLAVQKLKDQFSG